MDLLFPPRPVLRGLRALLVLAPGARVKGGWLGRAFPDAPWRGALERAAASAEPGRVGKAISTLGPDGGPERIVLALLPDSVSRHNAPARSEAARALAATADLSSGPSLVVACAERGEHAAPLAHAVAKILPLFHRATGMRTDPPAVSFVALDLRGKPISLSALAKATAERIRWAAALVDAPPAEVDAAGFEAAARRAARGIPHLKVSSIVGAALLDGRLGGIHAVGRVAPVPPRLVLLEYRPPRARRTVGLVGKGVVYDTGGLALKPRDGMVGMKADMAGAAAVVGATLALAATGHRDAIVCAAPLAENAIGPGAYRNDDILTLHSGKTVEVNNTDAEGRLLLADAVSYLVREKKVDLVLDAATLTGAQPVATGVRHGAVVTNRGDLEDLAVRVGRECGDLLFPLPFAPEFFQEEFRSKVADMKNSVANRSNAQSSCAAQFVYAHLDGTDIPWIHLDIAGPAFRDERATGFGVALLTALLPRLPRTAPAG
jgi:probable aminopeptidase NPEPL1